MRQIPLPIGPETLPTLDGFIAGSEANAAALAHLRALPEHAAPPVYLWGPSGCGKTHLLRALLQARQAAGQRTGSFDAATAAPWTCDPDWAAVAIDDCQALDAERQLAAFALFVEAQAHGVPLLAAGRLPPVDLPLREDLRTRLAWGHVFALQPLLENETRAALRREADRRGILLSDEVMGYLMTRFERDLKHLMALLDRLDEFALASARPVTVPLLKRMLVEESA
jgi:DnaA family protein